MPKRTSGNFVSPFFEDTILKKFFPIRRVESLIRGMLAAVLVDEGRMAEPRREAQPRLPRGRQRNELRDLEQAEAV